MKVVEIDIDKLKPYENNVKLHPQWQIEQLKKSIKDYGFNDPIGIDKDFNIVEGHGRYEAVKELGYKKIPCIVIEGTNKDIKAYRIVHNKLNSLTSFDNKILESELDYLMEKGVNFESIGFDNYHFEDDIEEIEIEEDDVVEYEDYHFKYKCPCCEELLEAEERLEIKDE